MNYSITLSSDSKKAMQAGKISSERLFDLLDRFISKIEGKDMNIDLVKLNGIWNGYYRIRLGYIRIIIKPDFEGKSIHIKSIDNRGDVYKR